LVSSLSGVTNALRHGADRPLPQTIVYVLKSKADPTRYCTGLTSNARRLDAHNAGRVPHTDRYKPWVIDIVVQFGDESRAVAFEKYLKSGSGAAFAQRHLR
jgi:predicted GIY-YIG superfamily endonuclease